MVILSISEGKNAILEKLKSKKFMDLINKFNIVNVIVFGSILTDEFYEGSDVDIALIGEEKIQLDNILDMELFLEKYLKRDIDIIDLKSDSLDIFVKINILNTGKIIYSKDNSNLFNKLCYETEKVYRENENFMYFRRRDVLS